MKNSIKLFESKQIRAVWVEEDQKWYFSVQDVIEVLTESTDVKQYTKRMLSRDLTLKTNWGTFCTPVAMIAADGKRRKVQAADAKGLLRIIQSIPSPKAEPFKQWLAKTGYERMKEIADQGVILATKSEELLSSIIISLASSNPSPFASVLI